MVLGHEVEKPDLPGGGNIARQQANHCQRCLISRSSTSNTVPGIKLARLEFVLFTILKPGSSQQDLSRHQNWRTKANYFTRRRFKG
jgi:hypothetical protein